MRDVASYGNYTRLFEKHKHAHICISILRELSFCLLNTTAALHPEVRCALFGLFQASLQLQDYHA